MNDYKERKFFRWIARRINVPVADHNYSAVQCHKVLKSKGICLVLQRNMTGQLIYLSARALVSVIIYWLRILNSDANLLHGGWIAGTIGSGFCKRSKTMVASHCLGEIRIVGVIRRA